MIELDLALVFSRLGDLAKANGHFKACLGDYNNTLRLRMKHMGKYCQKTSDAYYSLATAYTNLAAGEEDSDEAKSSDAEKKAWNLDSIRQYYECGLCFSGMAAEMVKEDPAFQKILAPAASNDDNDDDDDDDDDDDEGGDSGAPAAAQSNPHATKLKSVKKQLESFSLFVAPPPRPEAEDEAAKAAWDSSVKAQKAAYSDPQNQFMFCYEMLEEMIECVESADKNMEVLHKARENKEKAEGAEGGGDGTTIGFGDATAKGGAAAPEGAGQTTFGFGAQPTATAGKAPPAAAAAAAPMMVVTKKKKKTVAPTPVAGEGEQGEAKKQRVE
jgi:hypothetical protein